MTGLNPNTVYDFRVISVDFSPLINEAVSRNKRFTKMAFNEDTIAPVLIHQIQLSIKLIKQRFSSGILMKLLTSSSL